MKYSQNIKSGIYLVVDPSMPEEILLSKLDQIKQEKIVAIQIWDNFAANQEVEALIVKISALTDQAHIPLLINNRWELAQILPLQGVHFDEIPVNFSQIKNNIGRLIIMGLTCNNDLEQVRWAAENNMDYISFCSMYPSSTANSCALVDFETVIKAKEIFKKPIFLAGGINPKNVKEINKLQCDGIAVVSGILSAENPVTSVQAYYKELKLKI